MGGSRNGRILKFALFVAPVLFSLYMVYLYHDTKTELEDAQEHLGELYHRHEKLTNELKGGLPGLGRGSPGNVNLIDHLKALRLKDSVQSNAQVNSELRGERSAHSRTAEAKNTCVEDLKKTQKERDSVVQDKEMYQSQAQSHKANYQDLVIENKRLTDRCSLEQETAREDRLKLESSCRENERRLDVKVQQLENDIMVAGAASETSQKELDQCSFQLDEAKKTAGASQARVSVLEANSKRSQERIQQLENKISYLEEEKQQLQKQIANGPPAAFMKQPKPDLRPPTDHQAVPRDLPPSENPPPVFHDFKVTDDQKHQVYETLRDKLAKGEHLSQKQEQVYQLLRQQFSRTFSKDTAENRDKVQRESFGAQPPYRPAPERPPPGLREGNFGAQKPYRPVPEEPSPGLGDNFGRYPLPQRFGQVGELPPDGRDAGPRSPDAEEREEVDLVDDDEGEREGGLNGDAGEIERGGVGEQDKFDNIKDEEDYEGAAAAFDPDEIDQQLKEEQETDDQYVYGRHEEKDVNENLPAPNLDGGKDGRAFHLPPPLPPVGGPKKQSENPDEKYDDYDKNFNEDEEEDDDDDMYGSRQFERDMAEEWKILQRRDIEKRMNRAVSEQDLHRKKAVQQVQEKQRVKRQRDYYRRNEIR